MKFYIVTADYRKPSAHSPRYAFCAPESSNKTYVKKQFCKRYAALDIIRIEEKSAEEMEQDPIVTWISWL